MVEQMIIRMAQAGQFQGKVSWTESSSCHTHIATNLLTTLITVTQVNEATLKQLLEQVSEATSAKTTIKVSNKPLLLLTSHEIMITQFNRRRDDDDEDD